MRVRDLAERLGLAFEGDGEVELTVSLAPLRSAGPNDLSFIGSLGRQTAPDAPGCLIAPLEFVAAMTGR